MEQLEKLKYGASYLEEIQATEGKEKAERIWKDAVHRYENLVLENNRLSDGIKAHTEKMIFPAIAVYQALLETDPEKAMNIMETAESRVSIKTGASYRKLVSPVFMRRIFLKIFSKGSKKGFSDQSGFINRCIRDDRTDIAFHIEKCPYHDFCTKYGCPELTHIFCQNDINAYGNLPASSLSGMKRWEAEEAAAISIFFLKTNDPIKKITERKNNAVPYFRLQKQ